MPGETVGEAFVKIKPDTSGFANDAEAQVSGETESAFGRIGKVAGTAFVAGITASGVALAGIGAFGLKAAADLQQTTVAFEGILGSGEKAQGFLDQLQAFAAKTPFEFPELANASKNLLAVGFSAEQVIPTMTKIGNVAATLGVGQEGIEGTVRALGQMKGKGKASVEELNQISEAIPGFSAIKAVAEGMGISVEEAFARISTGGVPADEAINAILVGMDKFPGAAGAMERQSVTLAGVWSTLKDTFRTGLVEGINPILPALSGALQGIAPVVEQVTGTLGDTLGSIFQNAVPVIQGLLPVIGQVLNGLGQAASSVLSAIAPVIQTLGPVFAQVFASLQPLIDALAHALAPVIGVLLQAIGPVISALADALTPIIKALAPIVTEIAARFSAFIQQLAKTGILETVGKVLGKIVEAAAPLISTFLEIASTVAQALLPLVKALSPILEQVGEAFRKIFPALQPVLEQLGKQFVHALQQLTPSLIPLVEAMAQLLVELLPLLPPLVELTTLSLRLSLALAPLIALLAEGLAGALRALTPIVHEVVGVLQHLPEFFEELPGKILAGLGALPGLLKGLFTDAVNGALDVVKFLGEQIIDYYVKLPGRILDVLGALVGILGDAFRNAMNAGLDVVKFIAGIILDELTGFPGRVTDALAGLAGTIKRAFEDAMNDGLNVVKFVGGAIINELGSLPGRALEALGGIVHAIKGPFEDAAGGASDVVEFAAAEIVGFINGIPGRLDDIGGAVVGTIVGPLKAAWNAIADIINGIHFHIGGFSIFDQEIIPAFDFNPPHVPHLARGGVALSPQLAVVGDRPEAIIPLDKMSTSTAQQRGEDHYHVHYNAPPPDSPVKVAIDVARSKRAANWLVGI